MLKRFAVWMTRVATNAPKATIGVFVLLLGIGIAGSSRLEMRLNYLELLPENDSAVKDLHWVMKKAGSEGYLVTGISGGTRDQRLRFAAQWADTLSKRKDMRYAEFRYDVEFFRKHGKSLLPLATIKEIRAKLEERVGKTVERSLDLGLDDDAPASKPVDDGDLEQTIAQYEAQLPAEYIEDKAKTELFVLAKPAMETSNLGAVGDALTELRTQADEALKAYPGLVAGFGGPMVFQKAFDDGIRGDLGRISFWSFALASFFLLLATRRPLASGLIIVPIAIAIAVTLAFAAVVIGHLTIISGILVAVLLGLGVEFGIHLVLRTAEARAHLEIREALAEAVPETMEGAFTGAVTNGAAFAVLMLCDFKAFREFGGIAAMGISLSWLFTYALLPALILLIEQHFPGWVIRKPTNAGTPLKIPRRLIWAVVLVVPLIGIYGAFVLPEVSIERSFANLHSSNPDPVGTRAGAAMNTTLTPVILWVKSLGDAKKLEALIDEMRGNDTNPQGSALGGSVSLARLVHDDWVERDKELARIQTQLKRLPTTTREKYKSRLDEVQTMLDTPKIALEQVPIELRRKFTPLDGEGTLILLSHSRSLLDAAELDAFVKRTEEMLDEAKTRGIETRAMSENRIAVHIFRQVFADAPFIAWAAMLVALLTLFLLLRSVSETLLVFTPIALGMLMMVVGLHFFGVKLNFINMTVIPSIFTVAIDNTVHLYHRYREEGRSAMPLILRNTGAAVFIATCVNASGYGPTLLARFYGLKTLGLLATSGMVGMIISTVLWFPALLMLLPDRNAAHAKTP